MPSDLGGQDPSRVVVDCDSLEMRDGVVKEAEGCQVYFLFPGSVRKNRPDEPAYRLINFEKVKFSGAEDLNIEMVGPGAVEEVRDFPEAFSGSGLSRHALTIGPDERRRDRISGGTRPNVRIEEWSRGEFQTIRGTPSESVLVGALEINIVREDDEGGEAAGEAQASTAPIVVTPQFRYAVEGTVPASVERAASRRAADRLGPAISKGKEVGVVEYDPDTGEVLDIEISST